MRVGTIEQLPAEDIEAVLTSPDWKKPVLCILAQFFSCNHPADLEPSLEDAETRYSDSDIIHQAITESREFLPEFNQQVDAFLEQVESNITEIESLQNIFTFFQNLKENNDNIDLSNLSSFISKLFFDPVDLSILFESLFYYDQAELKFIEPDGILTNIFYVKLTNWYNEYINNTNISVEEIKTYENLKTFIEASTIFIMPKQSETKAVNAGNYKYIAKKTYCF